MLDLSDRLANAGHRVIPFAMQHPENRETPFVEYFPRHVQTEVVQFNAQAIRTVGRMLYSLSARRNMATLIAALHPDLCHVHNLYGQLSPSPLHALREQRIPVVMTVHDHHLVSPAYNVWASGCGPDYRHVGIVRGTISRFHKRSAAASFAQGVAFRFHRALHIYEQCVMRFLAPSLYMKRQLVAAGFPEKKIEVFPLCVDVNGISPVYEDRGYVLFAGGLSLEKGVETVIELARHLPDFLFKIVGSGPDAEKIHALAHELSNVEIVGFQIGEALANLFTGARVVLVPSRVEEVFPLTVLEAMAHGKCVIASHVGGIPDVIEDRVNGWLVPPMDLHAWTEALVRLVYADDQRRSMAVEARRTVETQYRVEDHDRRLMRVYGELIEESRK